MRNQLSRTVGMHSIVLFTCGDYKVAIYTVLLNAVNVEILLLPVRVRHVENVRRITVKAITFSQLYMHVS